MLTLSLQPTHLTTENGPVVQPWASASATAHTIQHVDSQRLVIVHKVMCGTHKQCVGIREKGHKKKYNK